jgi:hypothetical protein
LAPSEKLEIAIVGAKATISYDSNTELTSTGESIGESISGKIEDVIAGQAIDITSASGVQRYFYPLIANELEENCSFIINQGTAAQYKPDAYIPAHSEKVGLGYYRLYDDSNIVFHCGKTWYRFGQLADNIESYSLVKYVNPKSGTFEVTLTP